MIIEVDRDDLAAALKGLKPVAGKAESARVVATGDRIQVHAGRGVLLSIRVPGSVTEEGTGWLFHRAAEALVRQLPRLPIRLSSGEDGAMLLESAGGAFSITPPIVMAEKDDPDPAFDVRCMLPVETFAAITTARTFAASGGHRPLLESVLVTAPEGGRFVKVVATNGHIMAEHTVALPAAVDPFSALLPSAATGALAAGSKQADALELSGAPGGWMRLRWARTDCVWQVDPADVYPNYAAIFPGKPIATWEVERSALMSGMKRLAALLQPRDACVGVSFNGVGGIVTRNRKRDILVSASQVVGGNYTGPEGFSLGVSAFYLRDVATRFAGADSLRLSFVSPERPVVVEDASPPDDTVVQRRFLMMPMRTLD